MPVQLRTATCYNHTVTITGTTTSNVLLGVDPNVEGSLLTSCKAAYTLNYNVWHTIQAAIAEFNETMKTSRDLIAAMQDQTETAAPSLQQPAAALASPYHTRSSQ